MVMKICRKCGCLIQYPFTYCNKCQDEYNIIREQQIKSSKKRYDANYNKNKRNKDNYSYSKEERRWAIFGALKASMLIGLAYIIVLGLVVLLLVLYFNKG